jgi:hypothetical protein
MKLLLFPLYLLLLCLIYNCQSKEEVTAPSAIIGKWQLIKIENDSLGKMVKVDPLPYQEIYKFNTNHTFVNYRNGSESQGSYTIKYQSDSTGNFKIVELKDYKPIDPLIHYIKGLFYLYDNQPNILILKFNRGAFFYYQKIND